MAPSRLYRFGSRSPCRCHDPLAARPEGPPRGRRQEPRVRPEDARRCLSPLSRRLARGQVRIAERSPSCSGSPDVAFWHGLCIDPLRLCGLTVESTVLATPVTRSERGSHEKSKLVPSSDVARPGRSRGHDRLHSAVRDLVCRSGRHCWDYGSRVTDPDLPYVLESRLLACGMVRLNSEVQRGRRPRRSRIRISRSLAAILERCPRHPSLRVLRRARVQCGLVR